MHGRNEPRAMVRAAATALRIAGVLLGCGLVGAGDLVGQTVSIPATDEEWRSLKSRVEEEPFLLAAMTRDDALEVILAGMARGGGEAGGIPGDARWW